MSRNLRIPGPRLFLVRPLFVLADLCLVFEIIFSKAVLDYLISIATSPSVSILSKSDPAASKSSSIPVKSIDV